MSKCGMEQHEAPLAIIDVALRGPHAAQGQPLVLYVPVY